MASYNRVTILGNLGAKPELRYTKSGTAVTTLRAATSEFSKDAEGEQQEKTEWHTIVVFGKTAENCEKYLDKGSTILVEGRLQTRKWEDKDGVERYSTEIVAQSVQFVGGKKEGGDAAPAEKKGGAPAATKGKAKAKAQPDFDDDSIPF